LYPFELLRGVEQEFRDEARIGDVRHDLISPMCRVSAGWSAAFQRENSPPNLLTPQEWEEYPDASSCCRYEGDPTRIRRFRRVATGAFALLSRIECPEGGRVRLPGQSGHLGWLDVVYATARCYATADLRASFGWWNWSGGITFEEDDRWVSDLGRHTQRDGPLLIPRDSPPLCDGHTAGACLDAGTGGITEQGHEPAQKLSGHLREDHLA